jgi:hypothetical protein
MEIKVQAGQLGIKGCYGEKLFTVSTFEDLIKKIRQENKFRANIELTCYIRNENLIFQFCKKNNDEVLFEFKIVSVIHESRK